MQLSLIIMLLLSALIDVLLGLWMVFAWESFARTWRSYAWSSFAADKLLAAGCDTSVLGFTLGLFVLAIAGLAALCALWVLKGRREGFVLSVLLGLGILVFGIVISARTGTAFNLALDTLRGLLIAVPAYVLWRRSGVAARD